ncbi:hypothetical protein SLEP1_g33471 [Rubroshorea leprosula]|uniref:Reverse transcriptase domain-containing protein n=1 Tax=Rubroshorea leprosula TaxID=152421 RepID=A0AAV5KGN9_9ROSI|nr:hypothetical protein SLEP1_g33471 [Rubroshorea leprosula]
MVMRSRKAIALWMAPSKIWLLDIYFLMPHYGKSRENSARQKRVLTMVDDRRRRHNSQREINCYSIRVYSGDELEEKERDRKRERKKMLERRSGKKKKVRSDHHLVLLCLETPIQRDRNSRPIQFEAAWLTHEDFKQTFTSAWASNSSSLTSAIKSVQEACLNWNKEIFGNLFQRKRHLQGRLEGIQNSIHFPTSRFLQDLEAELLREYHQVLHAEELFWCQKSRVEWIAFGDRNTAFYHASTIVRRGKNRIVALKVDGNWVRELPILKQHINEFFMKLFSRRDTSPAINAYPVWQPRLTTEDEEALLRSMSLEEVRDVLFSMKGLTSPRPDGIQPIFYQKHWEEVSGTLPSFTNKALSDGYFDTSLLQAHMVLIPKGDNPNVIQKFQQICLLNVAYKVLSKVLVNRLQPYLQHLIGPFQNSFLKGRCTTDNIILSQEAVQSMCKMKGKKGAMIFKIDLHKAFDSVDWTFLQLVLQDFNIPTPLIRLIMFLVSSLQLSVLWNGEQLPPFNPQRGLRQGDPLSPYLFIMCMERLSHKIQSKVHSKAWKPFRISRGGLALSHLFFADDLMLFSEASNQQVEVIMGCLTEFSNESGLDINLTKSKLYVSPNIQRHVAGNLSAACGIPLTIDLGRYLGVPILHGQPSASTYKLILEKIQVKLAGWKQTLLSMHLVNWRTVCRPRHLGGLGLRSAKENNQDIWVGDKPLYEVALSPVLPTLMDTPVSHAINSTRDWDANWLRNLLPNNVVAQILATPILAFQQQEDTVFWNGSLDGTFSTKSAFKLLQQQHVVLTQQRESWRWIWILQCIEKIKLFVWLLCKNRVFTNSVKFARHFAATPICPRCEQSPETPLHLLHDCYHSRLFWEAASVLPPNFFMIGFNKWLRKNAQTSTTSDASRHNWSTLFLSAILVIWKNRNALIFDNQRTPPHILFQHASSLARDTSLGLATNILAHPHLPRWVRWFPPNFPFLKLNTDVAMSQASGNASAGGLIRDHGGQWLHGFAINIGPQTSYMAELWGCHVGLRLALEMGLTHLVLEMDSLLAVQAILARKTGDGPASILLLDIFHLVNSFEVCTVQHTLREGNVAADYMASIGRILTQGTRFFQSPPPGIRSILHEDNIGTLFLRT